MKTRSVTDVARNFSAVLDALERDQEEVVLVRNQRQIARLVPEAPRQDALSVFGDLYRTLDDGTAMLRRLRRKPQLRITVETAETFGVLAAKLRKAGRDPQVRVNDLWLAAQ